MYASAQPKRKGQSLGPVDPYKKKKLKEKKKKAKEIMKKKGERENEKELKKVLILVV